MVGTNANMCDARGPYRTLFGKRTRLYCSLEKGHADDHADLLITGYRLGNTWPQSRQLKDRVW